MALSRRCKSSFRKDGHIHFEEIIICHIEKRVLAIFDWEQRLVLGFIRDFERIIISDLPSVSPCIKEGRFAMVNRISATLRRVPVIRFRYIDLISGDFHSAMQRLNPGNNSLREIPIKETVASPSEQFYLTTELSNVAGISFIFVTSFGRYPCHRWYTFSSGRFSVHRLRISTVRSPWSVTALSAAPFSHSAVRGTAVSRMVSGTLCLAYESRLWTKQFWLTLFCFNRWHPRLGQNTG